MTRSRAFDAAPETRTRTRPTGDNLPPEVMEAADAYYAANKAKNKASREETAAKTKLHKGMVKAGVRQFEFTGSYDGVSTDMVAVIEPSTESVVDVFKLQKMVTPEMFMQIVSATKTAVKDLAGEDILMQCEKDIEKPATLKVQKAST